MKGIQKKIGVLMGGFSREREISLKTGEAITKALNDRGYDPYPIDVDRDLAKVIYENNISTAFVALHGRLGEDGTVQGMMEMMRIPYTGSGVLASAIAMDKIVSKKVFHFHQIPFPFFEALKRGDSSISEVTEKISIPFPVVIKPACEGSTLGVSIVKDKSSLVRAIENAFSYDKEVIVEEFIKGIEITVGVLLGEVLPLIEISPKSGFYNFDAKYRSGETDYLFTPRISKKCYQRVAEIAKKAYNALDCEGACRVDLMIDEKEEIYLLEVNTTPGMTETSLLPKAAAAAGINFLELVERILLSARLKIMT